MTSNVTFHSPPSWRTPPPPWTPPRDWRPDPQWGPPPAGWVFYTGPYGEPVAPPDGAWSPVQRSGQVPDAPHTGVTTAPVTFPSPPAVGPPSRGISRVWVAVISVLATTLIIYLIMGPLAGLMRPQPESAPQAAPAPSSDPVEATAPSPTFTVAPSETKNSTPAEIATSAAPAPTVEPTPDEPTTTSTTDVVTPSPTPTSEPPVPELAGGEWVLTELELLTPDSARNLPGAPSGFANYAAGMLAADDGSGCTPALWIDAIHPQGFVYGSTGYSDCGGDGAVVIWADQEGAWSPLFATQDMFDCYELAGAGLPEDTGILECYADDNVWYY